jgi:uncharacterized coiled-coil DUF342 family protein
MNDRYAIEARKLGVKVTKQAAHIDMLDGRIQELQKSIRKANELIEKYRSEKLKLEDFVNFAAAAYPGCVAQYHAIKKLEDTR